jgi:hypothetical protein
MHTDISAQLIHYLNKMSYPAFVSSARVTAVQDYLNFVNYLNSVGYFPDFVFRDLIQIARNIANIYEITDYLQFDSSGALSIDSFVIH